MQGFTDAALAFAAAEALPVAGLGLALALAFGLWRRGTQPAARGDTALDPDHPDAGAPRATPEQRARQGGL